MQIIADIVAAVGDLAFLPLATGALGILSRNCHSEISDNRKLYQRPIIKNMVNFQ